MEEFSHIDMLKSIIKRFQKILEEKGRVKMDEFLYRTVLPYKTEKLENGKFILLNREYKPLGVILDDYVSYNQFETFSFELNKEDEYLYDDGVKPWVNKNNLALLLSKLKDLVNEIEPDENYVSETEYLIKKVKR